MNNLRAVRKSKGLTLNELSKDLKNKMGVSISSNALGKYERGNREPKLEMWQKLADYFDVPVGYLQGLGVSRDVVIDDLVNEMIEDIDRQDPDYPEYQFNLKESLIYAINDTLSYASKKKIASEFDYKHEFEDINDIVGIGIMWEDETLLRYLVKKAIPLVSDYDFLSILNRDDRERYYKNIDEKIFEDYRNQSIKNVPTAKKNSLTKFNKAWDYLENEGYKLPDNVKKRFIKLLIECLERQYHA